MAVKSKADCVRYARASNTLNGPTTFGTPGNPEKPKAATEDAGEAPARRGVKHRPQPKNGREPIPVPAGEVVYDSLKTSFVDFPRLITTLETEAYTGYVRLLTDNASGLILFREGVAQECVFDAGEQPVRGQQALLAFNEEVTHGHGVLDVVGLPVEIVDGLYDLVVARPVYTELYAAWVDMPALLQFLLERKLTDRIKEALRVSLALLSRPTEDGSHRLVRFIPPGALRDVGFVDGQTLQPVDVGPEALPFWTVLALRP